MKNPEEHGDKRVRVIYAWKQHEANRFFSVLVTEGTELNKNESIKLQGSLSGYEGAYKGILIIGTYLLSEIGEPPGVYRNEEARKILRKIGREDLI